MEKWAQTILKKKIEEHPWDTETLQGYNIKTVWSWLENAETDWHIPRELSIKRVWMEINGVRSIREMLL